MMVKKVNFLLIGALITLFLFIFMLYNLTTLIKKYNNKKTAHHNILIEDQYLVQLLSNSTVQDSELLKNNLNKVIENYIDKKPGHYYKLVVDQFLGQNNSGITRYSLLEEVINGQKRVISYETRDYKFPHGLKLQDFTLSRKGRPMRTIIISTWRSGSTFLGDILNSVPGNFYHYEPLLKYGNIQIRGAPFANSALAQIEEFLNCDYSHLDTYIGFGKMNEYYFTNNKRLWTYCKPFNFCRNIPILNEFCKEFPFQSMKITRLRLGLAEKLLRDSLLNVKVLLLVRDPRGTIQSRRKTEHWCESRDCTDTKLLCSDMVSNYKAAADLQFKYPDTFRSIRYEDLSLNPYEIVQDLFNFLGLDFHSDVKQYLDSHTKQNMGDAYSTFRNLKKAPFHWQQEQDLNLTEIRHIENNCVDAMRLWGYVKFRKDDNNFNPLTTYQIN